MSDLAWHFLRVTKGVPTLRDGRPAPALGEWLEHVGDIRICAAGLHASRTALQALNYYEWEGGAACLVEVDGVEAEQTNDKLACRRRRIVAIVDNTDKVLRLFARQRALSVMHMWDAPAVVREYLKTGDETKRDAAWAAARTAARTAAGADAWAAAWAAARTAARTDAGAAAGADAGAAARTAAWDDANEQLESMFLGAARFAPGYEVSR